MILFIGDIAFMLEVLTLAIGLIVLYWAKERTSSLLKWAGYILVFGGALGILCSGYYWVKYWSQGTFETAHPHMSWQGKGPMGMSPGRMPMGMMGGGMMMGGAMGTRHQAMAQQLDRCLDDLKGQTLDGEGMQALHQCMRTGMQPMMGASAMGQGPMGPAMGGMRWSQCLESLKGQKMGPEMRQTMQACMQELWQQRTSPDDMKQP